MLFNSTFNQVKILNFSAASNVSQLSEMLTINRRIDSEHSRNRKIMLCCHFVFKDNGDEFFYTGSGGRDLSGNKRTAEQSCDQTLTKMNR